MMNHSSWECWPVRWEGLPNPLSDSETEGEHLVVGVDQQAWEHIISKHIANRREPWGDLLQEIHRELVQSWKRGEPCEKQAEALSRLGEQVRHSLERPLVLWYKRKYPGRKRHQVWTLVLPCGATVYLQERGPILRLLTCYFPREAVEEKRRERRWRRVVRMLVYRYGVVSEEGILPPPRQWRTSISRGTENEAIRWDVQFVTLQSWGFATELEGCPWRGRLGDWPAAGSPKRSENRRRLRPWCHKADCPDV